MNTEDIQGNVWKLKSALLFLSYCSCMHITERDFLHPHSVEVWRRGVGECLTRFAATLAHCLTCWYSDSTRVLGENLHKTSGVNSADICVLTPLEHLYNISVLLNIWLRCQRFMALSHTSTITELQYTVLERQQRNSRCRGTMWERNCKSSLMPF